MVFKNVLPENAGIDHLWIDNFLQRLENADIAMHGMILMRHGNIVAKTFYAPYTEDSLHRMFSIGKSFVSIAIGILEGEGVISLDDHIVDYFEDKVPSDVHPYIKAMTIRDMLTMRTCHTATTFKKIPETDKDWVRSFFTVAPSHIPGACFNYDTSASHVLCALVEKLTGMCLLDYLRSKCFDEIGFSKEAYIMKAPMGESMAGSGLMATPMDLLKVAYLVSKNGVYDGKQLIPADYLKAATSNLVNTYARSQNFEEMQGYGYQFWRTTHDSFALYGMAGQLAIYSPAKDTLLITTADTMGRNGGIQFIYDAYWQEIYDKIDTVPVNSVTSKDFLKKLSYKQLACVKGEMTSPIASSIQNVLYTLDANPNGFENVSIEFKDYNGTLTYSFKGTVYSLNFGITCNEITEFPRYNCRCACSGAWVDKNTFLIKAQIIDEIVGNVSILITFVEDKINLMLRKAEESYFNEFNGAYISGHK